MKSDSRLHTINFHRNHMRRGGLARVAPALMLPGVWFLAAISVSQAQSNSPFVLGLPKQNGPMVVKANFVLHNVNQIDDEEETFEFTGVLTLQWRDERQAFDPTEAGVNEKLFQGNYQFNEISPGWYPQEILINESGMYVKDGVVLRVKPDGTSTLIQTINAVARAEFSMRRFPFDRQRLSASFALLGLNTKEVVFETGPNGAVQSRDAMHVPQWIIESVRGVTRTRTALFAGTENEASVFEVLFDVRRDAFFIVRLVMIPLAIIVLLSFSVFWMDRSSLGDRINISFIGILTGVAYQLVMSEILPKISYMTLINAYLNFSFLSMCATVIINLVVGALDKKGRQEDGDRLDRRCRWIFPLAYALLILFSATIAFTVY